MSQMPIRPSKEQVKLYLGRWDSLENYVSQENSLKKLFTVTYPFNSDIDDVLIKVCTLNTFYSTHIYKPFLVAKHIVALNIDKRIESHDLSLVNDITKVEISGKTFNFYSFASKYCSHHNPKHFPIYDSYVEKMLMHFKKRDMFATFKKEDLKNYPIYLEVLHEFITFYCLDCSLKELDKYLWQAGKECFSIKN